MSGDAQPKRPQVLAINAGSSSIKFGLYGTTELTQSARGKMERIGLPGTSLSVGHLSTPTIEIDAVDATDHSSAARVLIQWLKKASLISTVQAVGHRVVHGGSTYRAAARVDDAMVDALYSISSYSPEHLPAEIAVIDLFRRSFRDVPQVACFDTAFHHTMPRVAQLLPIPRRFDRKGIRRLGFHGLSYQFLLEELERVAGYKAARGRVILAHLGNGTSLAAIAQGESVDTTMAFTPAAGVLMGTRCGDIDPGLVWYLAHSENMNAEQFNRMVNHESGLLGVSETSSDMRDLLAREAVDVRASEAVALYCYQVSKSIGAFAAVLGGIDTLVFSGGIGENAPVIRQRICKELGFLGLTLNVDSNATNAAVLSADAATVTVRMIRTDEEAMIARETQRVLSSA